MHGLVCRRSEVHSFWGRFWFNECLFLETRDKPLRRFVKVEAISALGAIYFNWTVWHLGLVYRF
jgi:hypothetical protein